VSLIPLVCSLKQRAGNLTRRELFRDGSEACLHFRLCFADRRAPLR